MIVADVGPANPIRDFVLDLVGERVIYCPEGSVCVPNAPDEQVFWGPTRLGKNGGGELRVVVDRKVGVFLVRLDYPIFAFD